MAITKMPEALKGLGKGKFGRIGVLMGGPSTERQISLRSGEAVYGALKGAGLEVVAIDITSDSVEENISLIRRLRIDCAFLALHGRFGEDGSIQEVLETLKLPYTGSGVQASRLAMDKVASRKIFEAGGLKVPRYRVWDKSKRACHFPGELGLPLVIKPATHGSSIGLSIIQREEDLSKAMDAAFTFDERILLEEYIRGQEVTVGVLNDKALPVIEIIPKRMFFDYEAKYQPGLTDYVVPAQLENTIVENTMQTALMAHRLLGCFGCSRVDMILNQGQLPYVLEVNTIPGLTSTSLLPKAAKCIGIEFEELCLKLIELAYEERLKKTPVQAAG